MSPEKNEANEEPLLRIIEKLQTHELSGKMLEKETRLDAVDHLRLEGTSIAEIAWIMGLSDRTIKRDIEELKKKNAIKLKSTFSSEMVGELVRKCAQHWQSLKSIAHDPLVDLNEKILAEKTAWDIQLGLFRELREMGFLPSAPKAVVGQFSHQVSVSAENSWAELYEQFLQLKELLVDSNGVIDVSVQQAIKEIEPVIQDGLARQKTQETLKITEQKFEEGNSHGQE